MKKAKETDVFFDHPNEGELFLEHSFYLLDGEHILFVCKNVKGDRFLCSCCQMSKKWVIGKTETQTLLDLIDDKITIREVLQKCNPKWITVWDGKYFAYSTVVPDHVLPKEGELLELPLEKCGAYKEMLVKATQ